MRVVVVDCGAGNLASVRRALSRAAAARGVAAEIMVTSEPDLVRSAGRIVLPGQGAFAACAAALRAVPGLTDTLAETTRRGVPFLGICVGMQLMSAFGLEHGRTPGLGWITGEVAVLDAPGLRLPQMGWNSLTFPPGRHALLAGVRPGDHAYFVHSYALRGARPEDVVATTDYGGDVVAMVASGARAGTQFHVEKSQDLGLRILGNFLEWQP